MENRRSVDQRRRAVHEFFDARARDLAQQGSIVASYRTRGNERIGPYYRLTCRDADQRQISIYLGNDEQLLAETRERLARMQDPVRLRYRWLGMRLSLRRAARAAHEQFRAELANQGLILKGHEIRGWRLRKALLSQALNDNDLSLPGVAEERAFVRGDSSANGLPSFPQSSQLPSKE